MSLDLSPWHPGPKQPKIEDNTLHLWRFSLDVPHQLPHEPFDTILSIDELQRAEKLLSQKLKDRFVSGRYHLRRLLAAYLAAQAGCISFNYNRYGKPKLSEPHSDALYFNLAHSENNAVLAVSKEKISGVDLETIDFKLNCKEIVARYFTQDEKALYTTSPVWRRRRLFYRLWTLKESRIKAYGESLSSLPELSRDDDHVKSRHLYLGRDQVCCLTFPRKIVRIRRFYEPE